MSLMFDVCHEEENLHELDELGQSNNIICMP
jgi:hypothetical protein